jgi:endoglucanase
MPSGWMMNQKTVAAIGITFGIIALLFAGQSLSFRTRRPAFILTGVNISGAEFGTKVPGLINHDYFYPPYSTIDYFAAKGMNAIRLPVLWERLQHHLGAALDPDEMKRIDAVVNYASIKKMKVIIDVHNYAKYYKSAIGTQDVPIPALGDLWRRLALRYKRNSSVAFGLMNEPTGLPTETWLAAANDAIAQIRNVGADNLVLVPGNGWSSARDWTSSMYGTPNSKVMSKIVDPDRNYVFDVHQYFDKNFTGVQGDCQSNKIAIETLAPFTEWARRKKKRGFLGEFGVGPSPSCLTVLDHVLKFMAKNNDVWMGWTYWAGGRWPSEYFTNIEPLNGKDRPQMHVLLKYVDGLNRR